MKWLDIEIHITDEDAERLKKANNYPEVEIYFDSYDKTASIIINEPPYDSFTKGREVIESDKYIFKIRPDLRK